MNILHHSRRLIRILILACLLLGALGPATGRTQAFVIYDAFWADWFGTGGLNPLLTWEQEDPTHWILREIGPYGQISYYLKILTQPGPLKNILAIDVPSDYVHTQTNLQFAPTAAGQFAGLRLYQDGDNYVEIVSALSQGGTPEIRWNVMSAGQLTTTRHAVTFSDSGLAITRQGENYIGWYGSFHMADMALGYATLALVDPKVGLVAGDTGPADPGAAEAGAYFDELILSIQLPRLPFTRTETFNQNRISPRWAWLNEVPGEWGFSTENGASLRIQSGQTALHRNVLLQTLPMGDFDLTTRLAYAPDTNIQQAGLVILADENDYLMAGVGYCSFPERCDSSGAQYFFEQVAGGQPTGQRFPNGTKILADYPNYGKARVKELKILRQGQTYSMYARDKNINSDDDNWEWIGRHKTGLNFYPTQAGLKTNALLQSPKIPADFYNFTAAMDLKDWFTAYMPAVLTAPPYTPPGPGIYPTNTIYPPW